MPWTSFGLKIDTIRSNRWLSICWRVYPAAAKLLKQLRRVRNRAHFLRLLALLLQGRYRELEEAARDRNLVMAMEDSKDLRADVHNLLALGRLESGEFNSAHDSLTAAAAEYPGERKATIEGNLVLYLMLVGDYMAARSKALEILNDFNNELSWTATTTIMLRLASVTAAAGDHDETLDWLSRIMRIANSRRDSAAASMALAIAARIALSLSAEDVALRLLDHVVTLATEEHWPTYASSVLRLYGLALAASDRKSVAELALDAAIKHGAHRGGADYVSALLDRSRLAEAGGEHDAALEFSGSAFAAVSDGRGRIGMEAHKVSFLGASEETAQHHFQLLSSSGVAPGQLLEAIETWRLQVFRDVYRARISLPDKVPNDTPLQEQIRTLMGPEDAFASFAIGENYSFAVIVTSREQPRAVQLPTNAAEVRRLTHEVKGWMDAANPQALAFIQNDQLPASLVAALRRLYDVLVAPLKIDDHVKTLIVSPDSSLVGLPWPALIEPDQHFLDTVMEYVGQPNRRYLVERRAVVVLPSLQVFLGQSEIDNHSVVSVTSRRPSALLVGGLAGVPESAVAAAFPVLAGDSSNLRELAPLSAGGPELSAIWTAFEDTHEVTILLDAASMTDHKKTGHATGLATRSTVLRKLPEASIAHIAAHGLFAPHAPMASAVFLDPHGELQLVRAGDFLDLDLSKVQLVAISACQTARSTVGAGAETFGFLRGLMGAGARTVVLTEWAVDDVATSEWFAAFYTAIKQEKVANAARSAALAVLRARPHPFFWAAPTIYGAWR